MNLLTSKKSWLTAPVLALLALLQSSLIFGRNEDAGVSEEEV